MKKQQQRQPKHTKNFYRLSYQIWCVYKWEFFPFL